ncbi:MAG: hypothetical protein H6541_07080 [Lentimicrobiaceae bacterium]|nr:hypothetical protein [Lentimicrobiaceae bacterium]MCB9024533.1 hypothetical protein [Lentimicrobiaceae bacterium]MCO5266353.1 hypothetical protein [Lentimicrobium sp.]HPG34607.1 hypothetical protein [Lentimicrobium sp.]
MAAKRKRRKVRKFKQVSFKLTTQQKKRVDAFCVKHHTSPINMYKKAIMLYLANNGYGSHKLPENYIGPNQMSIFDFVEDPLLEEIKNDPRLRFISPEEPQ